LNKTVIIVVVSLASSILLMFLAWRFYARNCGNGTTHVVAQGSSLSNQPDVPQHYQQPPLVVANNMQTSGGVAPVNAPQLFHHYQQPPLIVATNMQTSVGVVPLNAPQLVLPSLPGSSDETPSAGFNCDETPSSKYC
jgi:hypothetical protein